MVNENNAKVFVLIFFLQFLNPSEATEKLDLLDDHPTIKLLIEENRYLKNVIEKLEDKFDLQYRHINKKIESSKTTPSARTCHELTRSDPTLESGMYYIDPDGWNSGDAPIYVYCDKVTGETRVLHDSQEKTNVETCYDPGCYFRLVNYNASLRQMRALLELSPTCNQYFRYDCVGAVLAFNDVQYSWWNNRKGEPQYFWAGYDDMVHTCSCGVTGDCVETNVLCNCDTSAPIPLYDEGYINHKDHLPVTRLNFGRTTTSSSGEHTLGPLKCSGSFQSASNGIPSSCADLWRGGETVSGLYQVKASDGAIVTVFCDMSKLPEEAGHQTFVGINDVKSEHVYFTVVREVFPYTTLGIIPYDKALLNVGNAMNIQNGKFTAPKKGFYFFSLTINSVINSWAGIYHKGTLVVIAQLYGNGPWTSSSAHATLQLEAGDVVYTSLGSGQLMSSAPHHHTHFTGYMLQEL